MGAVFFGAASDPKVVDDRKQHRRQFDRALRVPVDIHMDEMALGRRRLGALGEQADFVAHARTSGMRHADARLHRLGKRERGEVVALRLDDQADSEPRRAATDRSRRPRQVKLCRARRPSCRPLTLEDPL